MSQDNDWFFNAVEEFQTAFEASRDRVNTRHDGIKVTVSQLRAGDLFYHSLTGQHIFVCKGEHPIWPQLMSVVWCDPTGRLTIDALDPRQQLEGVVTNKGEAPNERALRFRQWYLERKK